MRKKRYPNLIRVLTAIAENSDQKWAEEVITAARLHKGGSCSDLVKEAWENRREYSKPPKKPTSSVTSDNIADWLHAQGDFTIN